MEKIQEAGVRPAGLFRPDQNEQIGKERGRESPFVFQQRHFCFIFATKKKDMAKLYEEGNYVIWDDGGVELPMVKTDWKYTETADTLQIIPIQNKGMMQQKVSIAKSGITSIYSDKAGTTTYASTAEMVTFLRENTGFFFDSSSPISISNSDISFDAFGAIRTSSPFTIFDSKQIFDNEPLFWDDQEISGSGTSSTHSANTASSIMSVSASTAGIRMRQTFMRFNYQPGKSHRILLTFKSFTTSTGIIKGIGYGDDSNGIFFVNDEGTLKMIRRTNVTGTPVDNETAITLSGIDLSKTFLLDIDFQWLGVGRVRAGYIDGGTETYMYSFTGFNNLSEVYMSTPNLPLRSWIENTGSGGADSFGVICSTVISEGGIEDNGIIRAVHNGTTHINANVVGTYYALLGIRLKAAYLGATVKVIAETLLALTNDPFLWEIRFNPTVAGTFTYSDETNSPIQAAKGDSAGSNTVTGGQIIRAGYVTGSSAIHVTASSRRHLGASIAGTRDEFVLCVTPLSANLDIFGSLTYKGLV